jgi:hypothetical protein
MEKRLDSILSLELPYRETLTLQRRVYRGGSGPRVAVTAGIYGDELEGLYLCHRLAAWLEELEQTRPEALLGQVELYPALNPWGLDTLQHTVPVYDSDLDRSFPGHPGGPLSQRIAAAVMAHLQSATLVLAIHTGAVHLWELPQARIDRRFADTLVPLARHLNLEMIWLQESSKVVETTLVHNLNARGEPCLLVVMGTGLSLTPQYTEQLLAGILNLWQELEVLAPDLELPVTVHDPLVIGDNDIHSLNTEIAGLFVAPAAACGIPVKTGELVGLIVSPFEGHVLAEIHSPVEGMLLTLRRHPLVYEGSLLARIAAFTANLE